MPEDYHKTLGVPPNASREEIVKAFRKKALKLHPDKNSSADAKEKFQEISFAYRMLLKQNHQEKIDLENNTSETETINEDDIRKHRSYKAAKTEEERAERILKAKELAKERKEKEREEELIYYQQFKKSIRYKISTICAVLCIFTGLVLTIDYFLPYKTSKTVVQNSYLQSQKSNTIYGFQTIYQNTLIVDNQKLIINNVLYTLLPKGDSVLAKKTFIFNDIVSVSVLIDGKNIDEEKPLNAPLSIAAIILLLPVFNFILDSPSMLYNFAVICNFIIPNIAFIYALLDNNRIFRLFGG